MKRCVLDAGKCRLHRSRLSDMEFHVDGLGLFTRSFKSIPFDSNSDALSIAHFNRSIGESDFAIDLSIYGVM
ncbi:hypothetical protein YC2023_053980 [Brassica napus]